MLESMTIFTKGGRVLYQYTANPSLFDSENDPVAFTQDALNSVLIQKILLKPTSNQKNIFIEDRLSFAWLIDKDLIYATIHPDILFQGPRMYLQAWVQQLLQKTRDEYSLFSKAQENDDEVPDPALFDKTFQVLLSQSKGQTVTPSGTPPNDSAPSTTASPNKQQEEVSKKKGKEKRTWHDGTAKVTDKAMAELDKSNVESETAQQDAHARALQEARAAYLPDESEIENENVGKDLVVEQDTSSWSSSVTGLLQQWTGNKILTAADLETPLAQLEELLTSKNVAREIANQLCQSIQQQLIGKRLKSLARVQTAVQQALERTVTRLLQHDVNLLRAVAKKRGTIVSSSKPYVICVCGINGVGKSTSLAKLAYYFLQNGCKPLLVAGDTFRSGAVEQLQVHADCLDVPLFSQGYSKDPSAVCKAAVAYASTNNHDVVLMDTAGRMQNNVPLMKALGKLVSENQPDCILLVCEALVGHDGTNQFKMFQNAIGRPLDGLILTKFDVVSTKVGAALTLTHETQTPIVFVGTGQKYHHLRRLNPEAIVQSLFQQ